MSTFVAKKWKKLTPADVAEIRLRVDAGETRTSLGREYGVSFQTVCYHMKGKMLRGEYAEQLEAAVAARRSGNFEQAAQHLCKAAEAMMKEKR